MKVLIISSTVSQSISVGKIATELNSYLIHHGNKTCLLYLDGKASSEYESLQSSFRFKVYYQLSSRSQYRYRTQISVIRKIKKKILNFFPDIIQLIQPSARFIDNQGLFEFLGKTKIPCIYTMIDENPYLGDCDNAFDCHLFKRGCHFCNGENYNIHNAYYKGRWSALGCRNIAKQKMNGYKSIDNICFVAPQWVIERAQESFLLRDRKFYAVDEYVNNKEVFFPRKTPNSKWEKLGINISKILILNIANYTNKRKGVAYFVDLANKMINDERYQFINVGFDGNSELLPKNYIGVPFVTNQEELAQFYTLADLSMITSLSDTMPNTCLEALSCGTPVCGFNITGIPYVAEYPLGQFVEPRNVDQLAEVVLHTRKKTTDIQEKCREYAIKRYSPEVSGKRMIEIYQEMILNK